MTPEEQRLEEFRQRKGTGNVGDRIFPSASGGPSGKITAPMATRGIIFRTSMRVRGPIAGAKTALAAFSDRHQRYCFALALWNGRDSIFKERLFGLTNLQGNHGEDVKEYYYYLDSTPTRSYIKCLYKYPQAAFPYEQLLAENQRRTRSILNSN